jgi:hypothetical protein
MGRAAINICGLGKVKLDVRDNQVLNGGINLVNIPGAQVKGNVVKLQSSDMAKNVSVLLRRGRDISDNCGRFRMGTQRTSDISSEKQLNDSTVRWEMVVRDLRQTDKGTDR